MEVLELSSRILSVTERDVSHALDVLRAHPEIQVRDAFHAATMINNGIRQICSTDPHFDGIPEIRRIPVP